MKDLVAKTKPSPAASQPTDTFVEQYRQKMADLLELTEDQIRRIKKRLKKEIGDWQSDTSELHDKLQYWNDLMENVVQDTDYPFEGASNVHIPIVAVYCRVYHSIERRSILGADTIWYAETQIEELKESIVKVEEAINYKARTEWNIKTYLGDVFHNTNRDGLGVGQINYVIETEQKEDVVYLESTEQFQQEFPSPEESGLSEQEYIDLALQVAQEATEQTPVEVPVEYEEITYRGPKGEVIELADFVTFPATAKDIKRQYCRGYGKRFYLRRGEIRRKAADGEWYSDAVKSLLSGNKSGSMVSDYQRNQEQNIGVSRSGKSDEFEFYELVYWFPLQGKDEMKLIFVYSFDNDELVCAKKYIYRTDNFVLYHIYRKPNQMVGDSVPGGLSDINEEIDSMHNQRINSRRISEVPSFKGKKPSGKDFDPGAHDYRFKPGVIFWMDDPEAFEQFIVQPVDFSTSMLEEANDMKICSIYAGVDPFLFSGNVQPDNPDAPGNKTAQLISQANLRMDDPLTDLREGVEKTGDICVALEYQFGPAVLEYETTDANGQSVKGTVSKRILRNGIKLHMHGVTVAMNPDQEFAKWFAYYNALKTEPLIGQSAKRRIEVLRNALRNGRVPGRDKILPSLNEIEAEEVNLRKQAMMQMQADQQAEQAKAAAAGQAQLDAQTQEHTQHLTKRMDKISKLKEVADALQQNGAAANGTPPAAPPIPGAQ